MNDSSPNNSSRRKFIKNTSLAATGSLIVPDVLSTGLFDINAPAFASNPTQLENAKAGTTAWQLTNPSLNREIEGYASLTSVNRGGQIRFFVSVAQAQLVNMEIYRMGWYAGNGARLVTQTSIAGINQPTPASDTNGHVECDWLSHYTLTVPNNTSDPTDWTSGVYLAKLTAGVSGKQSYIIFVVRDDARISDFLYQAAFSTYQSYNNWPYRRDCGTSCPGGRSLYPHNSDATGPAWKVSFNRPFAVGQAPGSERGVGAGEFITNLQHGSSMDGAGWEYNMVRWLEMKGFDLTYATSIDTHEKTNLLVDGTTKKHKAFLSVGHDEYWSWQMRDRVEQARDQGVCLGFFSSNVSYWQVRFETSPKTGQTNRTMVCYKYDALQKDPFALDGDPTNDRFITTLWRDSPPNRPEAAMIGVMYWGNTYYVDMVITNPNHWVCAGTNLAMNEHLTILVGYEVDSVAASSPANIEVIAHSPVIDTRYADTTIYTAPSGAIVFGAASNQVSWGLDDYNATGPSPMRPSIMNPKFQQMISNLLTRFITQFPVARPGGPYSGTMGTAVSFNGSTSSDPDGTIVSYSWNFGDGSTGAGANVTHVYNASGTFIVKLTVTDDKGAIHSGSTSAVISGNAVVTLTAPSSLRAAIVTGNKAGQVQLNWVDNSNNEELFRIERSLNATSGFAEIAQANVNIPTHIDKNTKKGTKYYYRVRASSGSSFSAYSNIVSIAIP
jgi:PKD repeat protein